MTILGDHCRRQIPRLVHTVELLQEGHGAVLLNNLISLVFTSSELANSRGLGRKRPDFGDLRKPLDEGKIVAIIGNLYMLLFFQHNSTFNEVLAYNLYFQHGNMHFRAENFP